MTREINEAGLNLIKYYEGFRADPYQDSKGIWTQGWGHTIGIDKDSPTVTQEEAEVWLEDDLSDAEHSVENNVTVQLSDNQYSALVSLVFNLGTAPLFGTLGAKLNNGDYEGAGDEFQRWCHSGPDVVEGLVRRRDAEKALFLTTEA
jgi:lysozyme